MTEQVSIIDLIANPEKYQGSQVIIGGFLSLEFEGNAIYLHRDDFENRIYKNGLWCTIDLVKYKVFDEKYVIIEGNFDAKDKGHMRLWSGTINDISRAWLPVSRWFCNICNNGNFFCA